MKKNKFMRLASVLLVLTLLSTCAISGTFAKYVTEGTGGDTARVAKWGVTVTGAATATNTMFASSYQNDANTVTVSAGTDKVVAPGTEGTFSKFTITGTPEVSVKLTYEATVSFTGTWTDADGNYYCPIVVSVNNTAVDTTGVASTADYAAKIKSAIEAVSADYAVGTAITDALTITWAWAFDGSNDAADTYLGNLANAPTISVEVTATVTQVD